jgi:hypothetical protein
MKSEIHDGMNIDWDMPITMGDGLVLRASPFSQHLKRDGALLSIQNNGC